VYAGGAPNGDELSDDFGGVAGPTLLELSEEELISPDVNNDGTSRPPNMSCARLMTIVECVACMFIPMPVEQSRGSLPMVAALVSIDWPSSPDIDL
jgi:hypothetical protein